MYISYLQRTYMHTVPRSPSKVARVKTEGRKEAPERLRLCSLWLVAMVRCLLWLTDSGCNFCSSHLTIALVSELAMMGALLMLLLWLHLF